MQNCETYRAQMLEHLYDLLDEAERQALQGHLDSCPACQAEMTKARRQQALLAAAARMEFPGVRFVPPEAPAEAAPASVPVVTPLRVRPWRRWAVAAVVLLALGGVGGPAAWYGHDYVQTRHTVDAKQASLAQARVRLSELEREKSQVPQERQRRKEQIAHDLREKQLKVKVTGPASVPTGAPATYQIETLNLNDQPAPATVTAQVMDGTQAGGKAVEVRNTAPGCYQLGLPPDLPVRPGSPSW
jgi:anti-sigma factor RsiW